MRNFKIEKPIFIVGSGRSGTTILSNLLSTHPELCWFSNYTDRYPTLKRLPIIHKVLDIPFLGERLKKNIINSSGGKLSISHSEGGNIFHSYCGLRHDVRVTENNRDIESEARLKGIILDHLHFTGKRRFINKQTANTQRLRFLNSIFDDAYFVHIIRDGRAVAASLFNVFWWNNTVIWWLGKTPLEWEKEGKEPIQLCGLHWKRDVQEILQNKVIFEERYIEIRYEDLVQDVHKTVLKIAHFCELENSEVFVQELPCKLTDMNYKWKKLTSIQQSILNDSLGNFLAKLNYKI